MIIRPYSEGRLRLQQWDRNVVECRQDDGGSMIVGGRWRR